MSSSIRWITFDLSCRNVESQPVHVMSSQGGYAKLLNRINVSLDVYATLL